MTGIWKEAVESQKVRSFYCHPLGRRPTATLTLCSHARAALKLVFAAVFCYGTKPESKFFLFLHANVSDRVAKSLKSYKMQIHSCFCQTLSFQLVTEASHKEAAASVIAKRLTSYTMQLTELERCAPVEKLQQAACDVRRRAAASPARSPAALRTQCIFGIAGQIGRSRHRRVCWRAARNFRSRASWPVFDLQAKR